MLEKLRNRQVHFYSTLAIVFAILVKMLVPIAHASNTTVADQTSFLATLCSGTKVVFVDINLSTKTNQTSQTTVADSQCSLCSITEQDLPNHHFAQDLLASVVSASLFSPFHGASFSAELTRLSAIRAPPTLS